MCIFPYFSSTPTSITTATTTTSFFLSSLSLMEDEHQQINTNPRERSTSNNPSESSVRSRWTPKPEQILILESIFNSGMVNPSKEDTIRIRKLLEKFGSVGDANVFYWFQNRRSRSRRRHRQLQAATLAPTAPPRPPPPLAADGGFGVPSCSSVVGNPNCPSSCSTAFGGVEGVFGNLPAQHELEYNFSCSPLIFGSSSASNLEIPSGVITVFINGVATQVPEGALDVKEMFGEEVILVHSSGVPLPSTEFGTSFQALQHGETYFLVPRLN